MNAYPHTRRLPRPPRRQRRILKRGPPPLLPRKRRRRRRRRRSIPILRFLLLLLLYTPETSTRPWRKWIAVCHGTPPPPPNVDKSIHGSAWNDEVESGNDFHFPLHSSPDPSIARSPRLLPHVSLLAALRHGIAPKVRTERFHEEKARRKGNNERDVIQSCTSRCAPKSGSLAAVPGG